VKFRRESYTSSFTDGAEIFDRENGKDGQHYLSWLQDRIVEFPKGCVLARLDGSVVGQLESRLRSAELGYVNLFYLVPEVRGTSLSAELHSYLVSTMRNVGVSRVQLTVSPTNQRAVGYYKKHGWESLGFRDQAQRTLLMELAL
jgi:RimJ/RimL family protein N-acetyltransferase